MEKERIQKVLAKMGMGSRREIEKWLADGRISLNGKPATVGDKVDDKDILLVDNKPVNLRQAAKIDDRVNLLLLNKPEGYLCSKKDAFNPRHAYTDANLARQSSHRAKQNSKNSKQQTEERKLVFDLLPKLDASQGRWVQVGRLDLNTSGLLLFTNHGELANKLMHPSSQIQRIYHCRVFGNVSPQVIAQLKKGVKIDDGPPAKFDFIESLHDISKASDAASNTAKTADKSQTKNTWWRVAIGEGRNREVRKIFASAGLKVNRLTRVQYGNISLPESLKAGQWQYLSQKEITRLMQALGLK